MTFHSVEPDANFKILHLKSENGEWELGTTPVLFGVRIRAGIAGDAGCAIDYCAGDNPLFQAQLLETVRTILETFPESTSGGAISTIMPRYTIKPISNDPCWEKLQALAKELSTKHDRPIR